jgi:hypothetical protein
LGVWPASSRPHGSVVTFPPLKVKIINKTFKEQKKPPLAAEEKKVPDTAKKEKVNSL